MFPTLPDKDSICIYSRLNEHGRNVKVGDIVLAYSPYFFRQTIAKRVIGMPGDYVVRDPPLSPTVGGAPIPGKPGQAELPRPAEPMMVQVPEGHVWLAGDNLPYTRDSRTYGPLPMGLITGKVVATGHGWFKWSTWRWYGDNDQLTSVEEIEKQQASEAQR
jgi:inner membrane protease subunit 1